MLVAFIGQAIASTAIAYSSMSCVHESMKAEMPMMSHDIIVNEAGSVTMNHSDMMTSDTNQAPIMDCCQEQCKCPMNGCVSLSLLVNNSFSSEPMTDQKIFQSTLIHLSQVNTSLYRPPISYLHR